MAGKTVSFNANCNLYEYHLEALAKWLSCNGEVWGIGPTAVFASAAALFLYNELEATVFVPGDQEQVSMLEKSLISTMLLGMFALMIHLWVCSMRFFQYYLDTVIKDSPSMLLEMTTAGLLGGQAEMVPLGPLTRFLRTQQPQIHITVCWFLSLCYADYVRKHYCQRFNMPYLEQWQAELQDRAVRMVHQVMARVNFYVTSIHQLLPGYAPTDASTRAPSNSNLTDNTDRSADRQREKSAEDAVPPAVPSAVPPAVVPTSSKRVSDTTPPNNAENKVRYRIVSQSSETTADAIEQLRYLATKNLCSEERSENSSRFIISPTPDSEPERICLDDEIVPFDDDNTTIII